MSVASSLPYLAIQGSEDQHIIPPNHEKFMKAYSGNLRYHLLPGIGHAPFWESPEQTNKLILEFIEEVTGKASNLSCHLVLTYLLTTTGKGPQVNGIHRLNHKLQNSCVQ